MHAATSDANTEQMQRLLATEVTMLRITVGGGDVGERRAKKLSAPACFVLAHCNCRGRGGSCNCRSMHGKDESRKDKISTLAPPVSLYCHCLLPAGTDLNTL